jgi:hypothetical protein
MDYAETEDVLFKQFPCSCAAPNCRGWITGRREVHPAAIARSEHVQRNQVRR